MIQMERTKTRKNSGKSKLKYKEFQALCKKEQNKCLCSWLKQKDVHLNRYLKALKVFMGMGFKNTLVYSMGDGKGSCKKQKWPSKGKMEGQTPWLW